MGEPSTANHDALAEREREIVVRLAKATGLSPEEIRAEARRRALRFEVDSMRRNR